MSPSRKTYAVAEAVVASDPDLEPIVVRFDDQPGRPPQVFDFVEFADFPARSARETSSIGTP